MDTKYVSDFSTFISRYMADHPEVVQDQKKGRSIYWKPQFNLATMNDIKNHVITEDKHDEHQRVANEDK
ncbi:MAG: DUF3460 family protein [Pseudomonadota bacterium]